LVTQVATRFGEQGGKAIDIAIAPALPQLRIDPVQGERMVQHLLRTVISLGAPDEPVRGACWLQPDGGAGRVALSIDRPSSIMGMEEAQLLDPGHEGDGDWADGPLLGLGFSLRLIRGLAATCGGGLEIEARRLVLTVPAVSLATDAAEQA
jgi:hypothetical protein